MRRRISGAKRGLRKLLIRNAPARVWPLRPTAWSGAETGGLIRGPGGFRDGSAARESAPNAGWDPPPGARAMAVETETPGNLAVSGGNWGVGARHALFPDRRHLALDHAGRLPAPRRHSLRQAEVSVS